LFILYPLSFTLYTFLHLFTGALRIVNFELTLRTCRYARGAYELVIITRRFQVGTRGYILRCARSALDCGGSKARCLVTGDKDLREVRTKAALILTPRQFCDRYL
jgi:hypothetical protein